MTRTATSALNDPSMRRRLLLRVHPDQGGDGDLFIWTRELLDHAKAGGCSGCPSSRTESAPGTHGSRQDGRSAPERVDFPNLANHVRITERAVAMAADVGMPYSPLLEALARCGSSPVSPRQERTGATYKQLALIAHLAGMSADERVGWYGVAEAVPLSQWHASFLINYLHGVVA